ncbi:hypothetical protein [Sulfolobus islandicus rod-shaped virus 3]|uniref:C2H2-type domain-containing protein n=3 Tax=root TaxID=1 RepID=A0A1B3SN07_9VIRU|nr:hypothetical protein BHS13_gp06 [Sulfolobus islandicus rudivirus 3]AOG61566.1 hypothetical protein [Sulfolobus islandicus rod-shaped virus 3]
MKTKMSKKENKKNKVYFCRMCSFVATDLDELDFHYKMSHESFDEDSFW